MFQVRRSTCEPESASFPTPHRARRLPVGQLLPMTRKRALPPKLPPETEARLLEAAWKETLSAVTLGFIHDLNNNLTGILGLTELVLIEARPEGAVLESLNQIKRGTRQAAQLMERLAALHRTKMGRRELHDLNALVAQNLEFLRLAVPKRLQLVPELSATTLPILADAVAFQHAFSSVILCAVQFTPQQGRIVIQSSIEEQPDGSKTAAGKAPSGPRVSLAVCSDGARLPARALPALLESWALPKTKDGKAGWGMVAASRFAEHHGGVLSVNSIGASGLIVRFLLPAAILTDG